MLHLHKGTIISIIINSKFRKDYIFEMNVINRQNKNSYIYFEIGDL